MEAQTVKSSMACLVYRAGIRR